MQKVFENLLFQQLIKQELQQDLGLAGDITTQAIIQPDQITTSRVIACQAGCVCGLTIALQAFHLLDTDVQVELHCRDGQVVTENTVLATVTGKANAILSAERTALNVLAHLSGIATLTHTAVQQVAAYNVAIACTRKTTPGLRGLEKYAVRTGGGMNHRFGLFDAMLIKDNHIQLAGSIDAAITAARNACSHVVNIEVEVDTLAQLKEALALNVDLILLDNMTIPTLQEAVKLTAGQATLESSGGVRLDNLTDIAATGVDIISLGWLTHSAPALDVTLQV